MNTRKRMNLLWAGSVVCFFLFTAPGTTMAAAICYIPTAVYGEPGLGPEGAYSRYGIFKTSNEAYYSVKQLAVDNITAEYTRYYGIGFPQCPGVRAVPNDAPYTGLPYTPFWYALVVVDICPQLNTAVTSVGVWGVYTPLIKGNPNGFSDASVDRINAFCSEQQYIIKLSNDANPPASGDLAEVEPSKITTTLRATVYDSNNQPLPNINVKLEVTVEANSGGHQHNVNRPKGTISPAEGNTGPDSLGHPFTFTAPASAGDHKIKATCIGQGCTQEGPDKVWVGVKGLVGIPSSGFWEFIGETAIHPANHYLNGAALGELADLARIYKQVYFPFSPVLRLNDSSLERGGVFDVDLGDRTVFWTPPHHEHRRGVVIDIQANGTATAIPLRNFEDFETLMTRRRMTWIPEQLNQSGGHYHVRLLGIAQ